MWLVGFHAIGRGVVSKLSLIFFLLDEPVPDIILHLLFHVSTLCLSEVLLNVNQGPLVLFLILPMLPPLLLLLYSTLTPTSVSYPATRCSFINSS